jgi:hypothetical protein
MPTSSLVFIRGTFKKLRCNEKICVAFTLQRYCNEKNCVAFMTRGGIAGAKVSAVLRTLRRTYIVCVEVDLCLS